MNKLPVELVEIILEKTLEEPKNYCKSSKYINSICQDFFQRKIKKMGYNIPDNKLNYIDIYYLLKNAPFEDKNQRLISAFLDGCYNDNLDIIKFIYSQDIMQKKNNFKSLITGNSSGELSKKCYNIASNRNYKTLVEYLSKKS